MALDQFSHSPARRSGPVLLRAIWVAHAPGAGNCAAQTALTRLAEQDGLTRLKIDVLWKTNCTRNGHAPADATHLCPAFVDVESSKNTMILFDIRQALKR
jgi:hypothetical protein